MNLRNRWVVLAILSSALLLITVDMTVLYTALPRLTHDLAASAAEKLWIVNAYPLVVAGLLPGFGTLGDRFGHKRLFVGGLAVFGTASLVAAFAPAPAVLIGARVLLAVGASMMMPATLSIIRLTFDDERERALAIGVWAAIASGGAALGPVVGGVLLEFFWWGSVFLVNVPVVLVALVLALRAIDHRPGRADRPWDAVGSLQLLVGLVAVAFAIKEVARAEGTWQTAMAAALAGALALAAFAARQNRLRHKLIDFSLFRDAGFAAGVAAALVASLAVVGVELAVLQRLQLVVGLSPLDAAILIMPVPLAAVVASPLAGLALPRLGVTNVLSGGLALAGLGLALYLVSFEAATAGAVAGFVLLGLGLGAAMSAASSAIMLHAPRERAGMAASIEEVSYELGGALGIAVLGSMLTAVYSLSLALPAGLTVPPAAHGSIDGALLAAETMRADAAAVLVAEARHAYDLAFLAVGITLTAVLLLAAAAVRLHTTRHRAPAGP